MSISFRAVALLVGSVVVGTLSTSALAEGAHRFDDTNTLQLASANLSSQTTFRHVDGAQGFGWQPVAIEALEMHIDSLVKVVDVDGRRHMGALREVNGGRIVLEHAALDGGGCTELALAAVRDLQVFTRLR